MSERSHRVALIGAGRIAGVHLGYLRGVRNAKVVAVCDADPRRAEAFANERKIPAHFSDVEEMMRRAEPSTVHIVTPPTTHAPLAIEAMERGANVLVEKPMAMRVDECDRMIETAERHGRRICVDHNRLFDPVIRKACFLLESGALGQVVSVEALQGVNPVELGGGGGGAHWSVADAFAPLYNLGPHPLYLCSKFLGAIRGIQVAAEPIREPGQILREARILLEGEAGFGYVAFSMGSQPYLNHLNVYGTKATLRVNLSTLTLLVERTRRLPKLVAKLSANLEPAAQLMGYTVTNALAVATRRMKLYPGIGEVIRRFYRSLDEGEAPPVDGDAGRENVRLLRAIEERLAPASHVGDAPRSNGKDGESTSWTS